MPRGPQRAQGPPYQQELFPRESVVADTRHPGQMPFHEWAARPDAVFHASHRADWEKATAHVGTQASASDRLLQVSANTSPNEPDSAKRGMRHPDDMPEGGRIWARRLAEPLAMTTQSDSRLNSAQWSVMKNPEQLYSEKQHPAASSPEESEEIKAMGRHIREGRPVGYENAVEDQGSVSALAPPGTMRSWGQDVAEATKQGLDVHPWDAEMSKQFDPHIEIRPKSMMGAAEKFLRNDKPEPVQETMFPYSVGDKLFEIRPDDTDWGGYSHSPGHDAGKRAEAFAAETGQKLGFGVGRKQWEPPTFPEGRTRAKRVMGNH